MSAHPSESPAPNYEPRHDGRQESGSNLLALADAIEACLQVSIGTDDVTGDERTVALDPPTTTFKPQQNQRVLTTQPLAVQSKPTAIFASRLPQLTANGDGGRPAHFLAAPGIELAAPAPVVIAAATHAPMKGAEPQRVQTLFVQAAKRRGKAPWLAAVAVLVAAVAVGGFVGRARLQQQLHAQTSATGAPVVAAAQPVFAAVPVVVIPAVIPAPIPAAPVVLVAPAPTQAAPVVEQPAQPVATPDQATATARAKHRETHARKPDPKPAGDTAQASNMSASPSGEALVQADQPKSGKPSNDAKPEAKQPDTRAAADAMLKAQLDSAL